MDVEIFTLCDFAKVYSGTLSLANPFDTIFAPQVPAVHPSCVLAIRIRFEKIEEGTHTFALRIIDQDGNDISPRLAGEMHVKIPDGRTTGANSATFAIQNLTFPAFGDYSVRVAINKVEVKSLPIFLVRTPAPPTEPEERKQEGEGEDAPE